MEINAQRISDTNGMQRIIADDVKPAGLFKYSGRIGRLEYFWTALLTTSIGYLPIMWATHATERVFSLLVAILATILIAWVGIAAGIKRCHDLGKTGWLYWLVVIPLVNVVLGLYLLFVEGMRKPNRYGPPLGATTDAPNDTPLSSHSSSSIHTAQTSAGLATSTLPTHASEHLDGRTVAEASASSGKQRIDAIAGNVDGPAEEYWATAIAEVEGKSRRPGLWAKAFSGAQGDERLAKANYMLARAIELQTEFDGMQRKQLASAEAEKKATELALAKKKMFDVQSESALKITAACPNCREVVFADANTCPKCKVGFGAHSLLKLQPIHDVVDTKAAKPFLALYGFFILLGTIALLTLLNLFWPGKEKVSTSPAQAISVKALIQPPRTPLGPPRSLAPPAEPQAAEAKSVSTQIAKDPTGASVFMAATAGSYQSAYTKNSWSKCADELSKRYYVCTTKNCEDSTNISELFKRNTQYGVRYDLLVTQKDTSTGLAARRTYFCEISRLGEIVSLKW